MKLQPIDTAPKDGTEIYIYNEQYHCMPKASFHHTEEWSDDGELLNHPGWYFHDSLCLGKYPGMIGSSEDRGNGLLPTHWLPVNTIAMNLLPIRTRKINPRETWLYIYNEKYPCLPKARWSWASNFEKGLIFNGWAFDVNIHIGEDAGFIGWPVDRDADLMPTHYLPIPTEEELNNEQQGA